MAHRRRRHLSLLKQIEQAPVSYRRLFLADGRRRFGAVGLIYRLLELPKLVLPLYRLPHDYIPNPSPLLRVGFNSYSREHGAAVRLIERAIALAARLICTFPSRMIAATDGQDPRPDAGAKIGKP